MDKWLFFLINSYLTHPVLDMIMTFVTNKNNWVIPILIIWLGLMIFGGKRGMIAGILLLLSVAIADYSAAQWIKPLVGRLRPCYDLDGVRLLVKCGGKWSFPSNHAANISAAMIILGIFYRRWRWEFVAITLLVSYSRIYVGVHYPGDVIGGIIWGVFVSLIIFLIWRLFAEREKKAGREWLSLS
jgi:undecaprenyl-diphosphatase